MRLQRRKERRRIRRKRFIQTTLFSIFLLIIGTLFLQDTHSKEAESPDGLDDDLVVSNNNIQTPATNQPPEESKEETEGVTDETSPVNNPPTADDNELPPESNTDESQDTSTENTSDEPEQNETSNEDSLDQNQHQRADNSDFNSEKIVYLTFDDGPRNVTKDILNLLDQYEAKATFFMLEPYMKHHPDTIERMIQSGHTLGLHGVTHDKNKFYASKKSVVNEMVKGQTTLEKITGIKTTLTRVPYGSAPLLLPEYADGLFEAGFSIWDWNIDSLDWKFTDGSYVANTISQIENFDKNEPMIILLHDLDTTYAYLEELLIYLTDQGYTMEALSDEVVPVMFNF